MILTIVSQLIPAAEQGQWSLEQLEEVILASNHNQSSSLRLSSSILGVYPGTNDQVFATSGTLWAGILHVVPTQTLMTISQNMFLTIIGVQGVTAIPGIAGGSDLIELVSVTGTVMFEDGYYYTGLTINTANADLIALANNAPINGDTLPAIVFQMLTAR